jgi:hypothetical protein
MTERVDTYLFAMRGRVWTLLARISWRIDEILACGNQQ